MARAKDVYTADGSTQSFAVTFPFISRSHVSVTVNGVAATFSFVNDGQITISSPTISSSDKVIIQRASSDTVRLVDYVDGSNLTESDLDLDSKQSFFMSQEALDERDNHLAMDITGADSWDAQSKKITDLTTPVAASDASNKSYVDAQIDTSTTNADNAAASATASATSATASAASATAASTSETNAATSYDNFDDRYLGQKSSNPSVNNDGDALVTGALYFNTSTNVMMVYSGSAWQRTTPTSGDQTNINSTVSNATNINTVAGAIANVNLTGGSIANVNTVGTNIASVNTCAGDIQDIIDTAADLNEAVSEIETVANDLNEATSEIDTCATNIANINTVGNNISNVNTVAGISTAVTGVNTISSAVTAVNSNSTNINAVNSNSTNINTVATNNSNVNTVAGISANVTTCATNNANITTTATNITGVNSFAERYRVSSSAPSSSLDQGDLWFDTANNELKSYGTSWQATSPSAADQANINIVGGELVYEEDLGLITAAITTSSGNNITDVADDIANVNTVAGAIANVNTTATNIANVNLTGGSISNVNTVGGSIADVNRYANEYTISSSAPGSPTEGDLWYDSTNNVLKVHNGSSFVAVTSATAGITDVVDDATPQLGGALDCQNNNISNTGTVDGANLQMDFGSIA